MSKRIASLLFALTVLVTQPGTALFAHEGHDHKIMGTVTMAASDHVMIKDKAGKDVIVQITPVTKIRRGTQALKIEDVKTGARVVVTAATVKNQMMAKVVEVGAAAATK